MQYYHRAVRFKIVKIPSSRTRMNASKRAEDKTPRLFTPIYYFKYTFRLRKKLQAEKLALELKIAEQSFATEIECLRAEQ